MSHGAGGSGAEDAPSIIVNPFTLPQNQQGWRGATLAPGRKRKWWTVIQNDQCLVTALLLPSGERTVPHSHESGELSIAFRGDMLPIVTWHPPGQVHGNESPAAHSTTTDVPDLVGQTLAASASGDIATVLRAVADLQAEIRQLQQEMAALKTPMPAPRVILDVLFPPFKTTIHDPEYPAGHTVVGQWAD